MPPLVLTSQSVTNPQATDPTNCGPIPHHQELAMLNNEVAARIPAVPGCSPPPLASILPISGLSAYALERKTHASQELAACSRTYARS